MQNPVPFYLKSTLILFGLILLSYALFTLSSILAPIAFSFIIAILLNPLVNKFQHFGLNKIISISVALIIALVCVGGILFFISSQAMNFGDNLPELKVKFSQHFAELQNWAANYLKVPLVKQQKILNEAANSSQVLIGRTLGGAIGVIGFFILVPVYVFLLLLYKSLMINFLHEVFEEKNESKVSAILVETKTAIQSYMVGLLLEALVVAILNSIALFICGVPYAILLGVVGALLNMLPYIGGIIAIALPVLIATITKDGLSTQIAVIISYTVIQFIDNNLLVPWLVSSRVRINAFFSIVIVLLGGALWGISGMFMSIPFLAILKIIFDRIPEMKPWGKLLGDEIPTVSGAAIWKKKLKI
ncbi:AI-2E family transporter [soil metagenome]